MPSVVPTLQTGIPYFDNLHSIHTLINSSKGHALRKKVPESVDVKLLFVKGDEQPENGLLGRDGRHEQGGTDITKKNFIGDL